MNQNPLIRFAVAAYGWIIKIAARFLQPVFLLIIRLYWGWQFFETGKGKLMDIPKVTGFFQSLGIPFPGVNAYLAGCTECFGGLLLLAGLASRVTTVPLIFTMIIAYITASPDAVKNIFSKLAYQAARHGEDGRGLNLTGNNHGLPNLKAFVRRRAARVSGPVKIQIT
jgi:putative oxidoreductase